MGCHAPCAEPVPRFTVSSARRCDTDAAPEPPCVAPGRREFPPCARVSEHVLDSSRRLRCFFPSHPCAQQDRRALQPPEHRPGRLATANRPTHGQVQAIHSEFSAPVRYCCCTGAECGSRTAHFPPVRHNFRTRPGFESPPPVPSRSPPATQADRRRPESACAAHCGLAAAANPPIARPPSSDSQ